MTAIGLSKVLIDRPGSAGKKVVDDGQRSLFLEQ
jgi:hypothetical protein